MKDVDGVFWKVSPLQICKLVQLDVTTEIGFL